MKRNQLTIVWLCIIGLFAVAGLGFGGYKLKQNWDREERAAINKKIAETDRLIAEAKAKADALELDNARKQELSRQMDVVHRFELSGQMAFQQADLLPEKERNVAARNVFDKLTHADRYLIASTYFKLLQDGAGSLSDEQRECYSKHKQHFLGL